MKKPADQGPVGPGWKLAWIEAVARDLPDAAGAPLAVAVVISSRVDSYGVVKNVTHQQIAKRLDVSIRTVVTGYAALKARGHIEILKESRGRGAANEIKIVRSERGKSWQDPASQQDPATQDSVQKLASSRTKASEILPTLPLSLPDSFQGAAPQPDFLARCWNSVLKRLSEPDRLGKGKVQSWLGNGVVAVGSLENGTVVLVAKTSFIADRNTNDHADLVLREWQRIDPSVVRVTFKHGPLPAPEPKVLSIRERLLAKAAAGKAPE